MEIEYKLYCGVIKMLLSGEHTAETTIMVLLSVLLTPMVLLSLLLTSMVDTSVHSETELPRTPVLCVANVLLVL